MFTLEIRKLAVAITWLCSEQIKFLDISVRDPSFEQLLSLQFDIHVMLSIGMEGVGERSSVIFVVAFDVQYP